MSFPSDGRPIIVTAVIGLAAIERTLYAVRADGAVFALLRRGEIDPTNPPTESGEPPFARHPKWVRCPDVPGTQAAYEREAMREPVRS